MRILDIFVVAVLATEAAAKCVTDNCLRALQNAPASFKDDCKSFVQITITPATSTISSSFTVTTTGSTTRTTTQTITSSVSPSKRWLERHEIIDLLLGRARNRDGPVTARATAIPAYASSPCGSSAAYESACSCLGAPPTTIVAPPPSTTQVLRIVETTTVAIVHTIKSYITGALNSSIPSGNSTGGKFGNSTAPFLNATSSSILSRSSSALKSSDPKTSSDKYRLKSPSIVATTPSAETVSVFAATSGTISSVVRAGDTTKFSNATNLSAPTATESVGNFLNATSTATRPGVASVTGFQSGSAGAINVLSNVTSSAPYLNSTGAITSNKTVNAGMSLNTTTPAPFQNVTQAAVANASSSIAKFPNSTISAPFMNITSAALLTNNTLAPFLNTTHSPLPINATTATARFLNSTSTVRFANTTTATPTATTTAATCETTSNPFAVRISQPGGLFDGWYLQLSGDGVIFNPSIERASKFSFDSPSEGGKSHLCSLGGAGMTGNASAGVVVGIAENRTDATGSAVYFVDPEVLEAIDNDQHRWYAPLECSDGGGSGSGGFNSTTLNSTATGVAARSDSDSSLACAQGSKEYWVGCGLGLDITSDGDGVAVVDGWNCTAVTLSIEYSASS